LLLEFSDLALIKERKFIHTTPKSFLELITLFSGMLSKKKKQLEDRMERYELGLLKLQSTAEQVDGLQEQL
jgi:dynein heavy chain